MLKIVHYNDRIVRFKICIRIAYFQKTIDFSKRFDFILAHFVIVLENPDYRNLN